eukprot:2696831-Alexandrium_andersonii.AAC.1
MSASQPSSAGASRAASSMKSCNQPAIGFQSLAAVSVGQPASAATAAFSAAVAAAPGGCLG